MRIPESRESDLLTACIKLLAWKGWLIGRNNAGVFRSPDGRRTIRGGAAGSADLFALVPRSGRFFAVETKKSGSKPTIAQQCFLERIHALGGVAIVIDDVKALDRVIHILEGDPWASIDILGNQKTGA